MASSSRQPLASAGLDAVTLLARYRDTRSTTLALTETLSAEDMQVQSMSDVSPTKWHLGHTTWFFETFVLEALEGFEPYDSQFRVIFNSYYQQIGDRHPRPQRGLLTRPALQEVLSYREDVDARMNRALERNPERLQSRLALVELGLNHEQQHQELLLMDIKHVLASNALNAPMRRDDPPATVKSAPQEWHRFPGGLVEIGAGNTGFAFDNERPRHKVHLEDFAISSRPITNRELLAFVRDGAYRNPVLWLADAWDRMQTHELWSAPMYWKQDGEQWLQFTLRGWQPLELEAPATHMSYYEADAYARWAGARLPTEAEWERTATAGETEGNFLEDQFDHGAWHPRAYPGDSVDAATRPVQMFGDVWEWTSSPYSPYPRFSIPDGAVGEYNGKFMANQFVLRGGSWATPRGHVRASYRNFFHPHTRWHFGGVRLAKQD